MGKGKTPLFLLEEQSLQQHVSYVASQEDALGKRKFAAIHRIDLV